MKIPTTRASIDKHLSLGDAAIIVLAPFVAIALRDQNLFWGAHEPGLRPATIAYISLTVFVFLITFHSFSVSRRLNNTFSLHGSLSVMEATGVSVALIILFQHLGSTYLDMPLATTLISGFILISGLSLRRVIQASRFQLEFLHDDPYRDKTHRVERNVILVGTDPFSAQVVRLARYQNPNYFRIIAIVDPNRKYLGHSIADAPIVGVTSDLKPLIQEYATHGVDVHEVWIANDALKYAKDDVLTLQTELSDKGIQFKKLSDFIKLPGLDEQYAASSRLFENAPAALINPYLKYKRALDVICSVSLFILLLPLTLLTAALVFYDVGRPVVFWQQRLGMKGRPFDLYKFRTLRPAVDQHGETVEEVDRLSPIGRLIRAGRMDEIPQLINILAGDMSLIGPRPLLPIDQPLDPRARLQVRPGVTGWAQINGGTQLTAEEKDALDVWYIRNASFWLDLKILFLTPWVTLFGLKKNNAAIAEAQNTSSVETAYRRRGD
jgi:lipopolysaccharide/colanic/teichoic acid biosynthesis glycosyltransferase